MMIETLKDPTENPAPAEFAETPVAPEQLSQRLPFLAHLEELRIRILRSLAWVTLGTALAFRYSGVLLAWLIRPVGQVVFLTPVEPFAVHLKIALFSGIALTLPILAWEAWSFIVPSLLPNERRPIFGLIPLSVGLFFLGAWFGWTFLLPTALKFLMSFSSPILIPMITVGHYIGFAGWLIIACGLIFQMPIVILFLTWLGIVQPITLLKQWRIATVAILIAAAVLTPTPDVVNQLLLAMPMGALYFLSVGLAFFVKRRNNREPIREN